MGGELQALLDRIAATSLYRWLTMSIAVISTAVAAIATDIAGHGGAPAILVVAVAIGAGAALRPASSGGLITIVLITGVWIATVSDHTTPWAMVVGTGLAVFHTALAAMAPTPISIRLDATLVTRWARRAVLALAAVPAMWLLIAVFDGRAGSGSTVATAAGLVTLAALAILVRVRGSTM